MKSQKLKIGVLGASGRMGQEVARLLKDHPRMTAWVGVSRSESEGFEHWMEQIEPAICRQVDVWIDFSTPEACLSLLKTAIQNRQAVVSGTTGLTATQKKMFRAAGKKIPMLWASNMSLGVAVLNEALKVFSHLKSFDFQIEEVHHKRKKDRPSGTALTLQENLEKAVGRPLPEPQAIRGGGVYGIHKVWALSEEELLIFEHSALNRSVFARGAVTAAEWISKKKPGFYSVSDLLLK